MVKSRLTFLWGLCQFWNDKSLPLQILYPSSFSWKITCLYFFSSNNIYFSQKEPIKMRLWSARVKFCQIPYANFETTSRFLSKFCPSSVSWEITPPGFFSSKNIYFVQKEHIKMKIFETFTCSGKNSSNSSPLSVLKDNSFVFFLGQTLNALHIFHCNDFEHFCV